MSDITNDKELVRAISELKHRLKTCNTSMGHEFSGFLGIFIKAWDLDKDPHEFATLPPGRGKTYFPRIPSEAFPDGGDINNCSLAYSGDATGCQLCSGFCPDKEYFDAKRR